MTTSVNQLPAYSDTMESPVVSRVLAPDLVTDPLLDRFDLEYLARKYWRRIVLLPIVGATLGLALGFIQEPLFESTALILVDPDYSRMIHYDQSGGANRPEMEALKSLEIAIVADTVVLRVMDRLDLRNEEGFLPAKLVGPETPDLKILKFLREKRVSTSLVPETRLIRIKVLDPKPERAKRLADALSSEFETYLGEQRRKEIQKSRDALELQAEGARRIALESDKQLDEFRNGNPQFPVEQDHELYSSRLTQFGEQLNTATGRRLQLESQKRALADLDPESAALEIIKVAGYNEMAHISALMDTLSASRSELSAVQEQFTDQHPTHRAVRARVARTESELSELAHSIKAAITASYLAERSHEENLVKELEIAKSQFAEMKSLSSGFRALQQQTERDWSVHQTLQSKLSESAVALEASGQIATMVSEPMVPYKKATPILPLYLIVGGAAGSAFAVGGLILAVLSGLPFSSSRQLEHRLGLPVIADWSDSKKSLRSFQSSGLLEYLGGNRNKAIQISAPELNGMGESVALKVSISAAQNGRQTLLLVIKPDSNQATIEPSEFPNLYLLELDPEFVKDQPRFVAGLAQLRENFDNIFIEAGQAEDQDLVNYLSSLSDHDVVVVGKGRTKKQVIDERITRLSRPGSPPVGLILVNPG
jgi:uncharacterized protein involved in exopolysaccharide biosynthesis